MSWKAVMIITVITLSEGYVGWYKLSKTVACGATIVCT